MTVEHLLTMSSGYECDENLSAPGNEVSMLYQTEEPDYYRYTLKVPMERRPGEEGVYCSIDPNLLGAVLSAATHRSLIELFSDFIAEPLQVRRYYLPLQPTGEPYMGGSIKWLPRDFMKFGQLMLDGGVWNGKRILSKEYAMRASSPLVVLRYQDRFKYGYLWWVTDYPYKGRTVRAYYASGNGGQEVLVVPELDMVIAFYAGNYADHRVVVKMIHEEFVPKFILPALNDESR